MSKTTPPTSTSNVTSGTLFGALKYNINEKIGWRLGTPTADDIIFYADLVDTKGNGYSDIMTDDGSILFTQYDASYPDQTYEAAVSNALTYNYDLKRINFDATTYSEQFGKIGGLLGMSFLPWSPVGLLDSTTGNYAVKATFDGTKYVSVNPMRREVIMIKLFTVLKIFGISIGSYFLFKLLFKLATKNRK